MNAPQARDTAWLIRDAAPMFGADRVDVRIRQGVVAAIAAGLVPEPGECVIDARGAALLPGLQDHHLHLQALAAARGSLHCGPPQIEAADALAQRLRRENRATREWLRGVGYHDSVAGALDRHRLDELAPDTPVRVQQMIEACAAVVPLDRLAGHYHDTFGMAIANVYASLEVGMAVFDSSIGGRAGIFRAGSQNQRNDTERNEKFHE